MEKLFSSSVKNKIHRRGLYKLEKSDNRKIRRELRKKRKNDQVSQKFLMPMPVQIVEIIFAS